MRLLKYETIKGNPSLNHNLQMESVKKKKRKSFTGYSFYYFNFFFSELFHLK